MSFAMEVQLDATSTAPEHRGWRQRLSCTGGVGYCLVFARGLDCWNEIILKAGFDHVSTNSGLGREVL